MDGKIVFVMLALLLLAGCQQALDERVAMHEHEILYNDVVREGVPANEIRFFGIQLADTEEDVLALHGDPDVSQEYTFGRIRNMEYVFGEGNETTVLYNVELGIVRSVLVTGDAIEVLAQDNTIGTNLSVVFGALGAPTKVQPLHLQRLYYYDDLGYEVYTKRDVVDRIYFTTPNRGIESPGKVVQNMTVPELPVDEEPETTAPEEESSNSAPQICIQVITPAMNPDTGDCVEYATPCDVPDGWDVVDACA